MTDYSAFFPEVLPYVHDCPEFVALNAIRNACIEFCDKSGWLVYQMDPITYLPNISEYDLDYPDHTVPSRVLDAYCDKMPLVPKADEDLKRIYPQNYREVVGRPNYYTQDVPETIIIVPTPLYRGPGGLKITIGLRPTRESTKIDDSVYQRWAEVIGYGARARLHDTPGQPYYDPDAALKFRAKFEDGYGEAALERNRGLSRTTMRVRPPRLV